jgi:hypothetical protein
MSITTYPISVNLSFTELICLRDKMDTIIDMMAPTADDDEDTAEYQRAVTSGMDKIYAALTVAIHEYLEGFDTALMMKARLAK